MPTQCSGRSFDFQPLGSRQVTARFDGGTITSDAGGILLREIEAKSGLLAELAACFDDFREGYPAGQGPLRHDPAEAAEDRGTGAGHGAPGVVLTS